jgi:pyruvate-ferredoxin/flavodoxin oxidoreductase
MPRKDLGLMAMTYGNVYVCQVAFGANDRHTVKALVEAESYPGASLVIAYAHCIAHGYDLGYGAQQQKLAVESGCWPLYRFDPRRKEEGLQPFQLDSDPPKIPVSEYMHLETRYRMLEHLNPERARKLADKAQKEVKQRYSIYQQLSAMKVEGAGP